MSRARQKSRVVGGVGQAERQGSTQVQQQRDSAEYSFPVGSVSSSIWLVGAVVGRRVSWRRGFVDGALVAMFGAKTLGRV